MKCLEMISFDLRKCDRYVADSENVLQPHIVGQHLTTMDCVCRKVSGLCSFIIRCSFAWICKASGLPSCQKKKSWRGGELVQRSPLLLWRSKLLSGKVHVIYFFIERRVLSNLQMEQSKKVFYLLLLHCCDFHLSSTLTTHLLTRTIFCLFFVLFFSKNGLTH